MKVFDASIEQMLWPEKRERDRVLGDKVPRHHRPHHASAATVTVPTGFVPEALQPLQGRLHRWFPWLVERGGDIVLGPIPKGVPVGLLANLKLRAESDDLRRQGARRCATSASLLLKLKVDLADAPAGASDEELRERFANLREPMLALSKCPDFVVNRGHYFGTAAVQPRRTA